MKNIEISLVLPIYNEGTSLENSLNRIIGELTKQRKPFEIILVEDSSTDNSLDIITKFAKSKKNIKIINHKTNLGRGRSVKDGLIMSRGRICGYMDVDCEVSPIYIKKFYESITKGYDMVLGIRLYKSNFNSIARIVASKSYMILVRLLLRLNVKDTEVGFKFFKTSKIKPILTKSENNRWFWDTEICALAQYHGLKIKEIPVVFKKRADKKSTVNIVNDSLLYLVDLYKFLISNK